MRTTKHPPPVSPSSVYAGSSARHARPARRQRSHPSVLPRSPSQHMDTIYNNTSPACSPLLQHAAPLLSRLPPPNTSTPTTPRPTRPGGYPGHTNTTSKESPPRKRPRTTPPTSDSDQDGYSRSNQPYDRPNQPERIHIPHPSPIADDKRSSEEAIYGRSSQGPRPSFAQEDKTTHTSHQISSLGPPIGERHTFATGTKRATAPSTPEIAQLQRPPVI